MIPYQPAHFYVENMVKLSMSKEWHLYIARNPKGILYTGIAKDINARIAAHNDGIGAKFTRGRGPWSVIHTEGPLPHGDALRRETAIKRDRVFKAKLKSEALP